MLNVVSDLGSFVLANLVEPIAVAVVVAIATAKFVRSRDAGAQVAANDRRIAEINEDLRRWISDTDRAAEDRMNEIVQQARAKGTHRGGALAQAAGKVYAAVLHEYRDAATIKQREFEALPTEGDTHARHRRRCARPASALMMPDECREALRRWRSLAADDVSRAELEPRLAALERADVHNRGPDSVNPSVDRR